ncbi:MAG: hypothetical protein ACM37W_23155 [Actinomycetota bacterium]
MAMNMSNDSQAQLFFDFNSPATKLRYSGSTLSASQVGKPPVKMLAACHHSDSHY